MPRSGGQVKTYPISEIFGPTIQGEGPLSGTRTFFVRFAGCDFDCSWCDTKYAVNPGYPGWTKTDMPRADIETVLTELGCEPGDWITLSGGNPALFVDDPFVQFFRGYYRLAMETQGSRTPHTTALGGLDALIISPKPPSSGMARRFEIDSISRMLYVRAPTQITALKYVVFDEYDLNWIAARELEIAAPKFVRRFLSLGTPLPMEGAQAHSLDADRLTAITGFERLAEVVKNDRRFKHFTASLQQHVLLWGQKRGV